MRWLLDKGSQNEYPRILVRLSVMRVGLRLTTVTNDFRLCGSRFGITY